MRIHYANIAPTGFKALRSVHQYVRQADLDESLVELVYLRVSQINDCAYCTDLHTRMLLRGRMAREKLASVRAWRDAGAVFDQRERAALAWSESVTLVGETHVPDAAFQAVSAVFGEKEIVDLTIAIALMNAFNRIAISFRLPPAAAPE